ncbi:MAG: FtsH protease activity modulator HflK [Gammaproteobacteria bacterium]|nr:FtsH protease activity modulator HflK [Gammaproteobacteria bacterium]
MGWNDPDGDRDPWGRKAGPGAWDLDAHVRRLWRRTRRFGHSTPPPWVVVGVILVAIAMWFASGFYVVPEGSRAVLLTLGREVREVGPGGHWHWPRPLGNARVVSVTRIHVVTIGYGPDQNLVSSNAAAPPEGTVLTADQGLIHVQFAVQYRVRNAGEYLFAVDHPRQTIAEAGMAAMREEVARSALSAVETHGQRAVARAAQDILQQTLDLYHAGVQVIGIRIQKVVPPQVVRSAFERVLKARQDRDRLISEAQSYANGILPKAQGEAISEIDEAQGYADKVIARARGRTQRFTALADAYARAPLITRQRLFIDGTGRVLRHARKVLVTTKAPVVVHVRTTGQSTPPAPGVSAEAKP